MKKTIRNKLILCALIAALALGLGVTASAHGGHGNGCRAQLCPFVDEDGDGWCDTCGRGHGCRFVDEDGDGICDLCDREHPCQFLDADGDGVCDLRPDCPRPAQGRGCHGGRGNRGDCHGAGRGHWC